MKKKRMIAMGLAMGLTLALTGCTTPYERKDVAAYVQDKLGLTDAVVAEERREVHGEDDYTDYIWDVTEADGTVFCVLDDYYWGMESVQNSLRDNWNEVHIRQYLDQADLTGFRVEADEDEMSIVTLVGGFAGRTELREQIDRLNALAADCPEKLSLNYRLEFEHPSRTIGDYTQDDGDAHGILSRGETLAYEAAEKDFLQSAIDMRYEDVLAAFSPEEIKNCVAGSTFAVGVRQADGSYRFYDDLLCNVYFYGASYRTIYELLVRNGYPVSGTAEDFSFRGVDGNTYELSDSFRENDWYYYKVNNEKTPMDAYFYNHFALRQVREWTGIEAAEAWEVERLQEEAAKETAQTEESRGE